MTDPAVEQPIMPEPNSPAADPLARALDSLEASVEQHYQIADAVYADPLSRTLDQLEDAMERRDSFWPSAANERLLAAIDNPEVGSAPPGPERREHELVDASLPLHPGQPFNAPRTSASPHSELSALRDTGQIGPAFFRPDAQPAYHVMGGGAGIRNNDAGSAWYCHLHELWVSAEDCALCANYQSEEENTGDGEGPCRHTLSGRDNEEQSPEQETEDGE
jgi:hypothetical protein